MFSPIIFQTKHGAEGDVEISEHKLDGSFVRLTNLGDKVSIYMYMYTVFET